MSDMLLSGDANTQAVMQLYAAMRLASMEEGWAIFMESINAAIDQAAQLTGNERAALIKVRPMLDKLADDKNWDEVTWFVDREPCVGFVFTGENEQGQTCDANEYAKDILKIVDAVLFTPSSDVPAHDQSA